MPKNHLLLLIFLCFLNAVAQNRKLQGTVTDTLHNPLDYANVMAVPQTENGKMQFTPTDEKGKYILELDARVAYAITVNNFGYQPQTITINPNDNITQANFKLVAEANMLDEIVIDYDYQPIVIKKDTIIYNLNSFVNGNERKLKDALEKLPGVEVKDNGDVTVQGKKVTQLQVEGKSFFGGGTKLAVENIPADAVDKVEVIDNFVEVDFLKKVSSSEDLAMNIKLKENKKKFVFGDIEAGAEIANDNEFYIGNAALFYYSPKTTVNLIADANTVGKRIFSYSDLVRFEGGISSFLPGGRKSLSDLSKFSSENKDVKQNKAQFVAASLQQAISKKVDVTTFLVFSKVFLNRLTETNTEYIQPDANALFETRSSESNDKNTIGLWNTKLDWKPNKKNRVFYNFNLKLGSENLNNHLETFNSFSPNDFSIRQSVNETNFKQFFEWHQDVSKNFLSTFVLNHTYNFNKPKNTWLSSNPFLESYLPIQSADETIVEQVISNKEQVIDLLLKNYWIINQLNHLYVNIGNSFTTSNYNSNVQQQINSDQWYDFKPTGYFNVLHYKLNDFYVGLEYKFYIGKLINTPGLYWHQYKADINQATTNQISKGAWLPQWLSEYEFGRGKKFRFNYNMQTAFATAAQLAEGKMITSYNAVYQGNALQSNEKYHNMHASLNKFSMLHGLSYFLNANYVKKENARRNEIAYDGINRFTTTVLTNLPEQRAGFFGSVSKVIHDVRFEVNTSLSWSEYYQNIDGIYNQYNRNSQAFTGQVRTLFDKHLPRIKASYTRSFNQINGQQKTSYKTDNYSVSADYRFLKHLVVDASYVKFVNYSAFASNSDYNILNASLRYQKKDNPWIFEIQGQNLLGNSKKVQNTITDYYISETTFYVLPRMVMLIARYKL
ncbi:carboxypeptidase-like regulatory domain-containing protein [Flavobacterium agricola]|uniref:Carboxypeptidase-like regulatory domain-containing protein n=1 Tax=Flavobacterium agricola TaxID=2870839 RepID=A0ABY6LZC1_9FLAO|nr:carboxypeptidase-like regulatory domain-containing protein [Flavobacterium agricola]UYW00795.1 carboxypeptidase-like regulatory domain-containing protein [Flavobacterium agricola]